LALNKRWLADSNLVALPRFHDRPDREQCDRLASALSELGVSRLVAVDTESESASQVVELDATPADLWETMGRFSPFHFLLLPREGVDFAVLCTKADFHVVAGPRPFVESASGDPAGERDEFIDFVDECGERWFSSEVKSIVDRVARYGGWVDVDVN
jgi:hypothetical protein